MPPRFRPKVPTIKPSTLGGAASKRMRSGSEGLIERIQRRASRTASSGKSVAKRTASKAGASASAFGEAQRRKCRRNPTACAKYGALGAAVVAVAARGAHLSSMQKRCAEECVEAGEDVDACIARCEKEYPTSPVDVIADTAKEAVDAGLGALGLDLDEVTDQFMTIVYVVLGFFVLMMLPSVLAPAKLVLGVLPSRARMVLLGSALALPLAYGYVR